MKEQITRRIHRLNKEVDMYDKVYLHSTNIESKRNSSIQIEKRKFAIRQLEQLLKGE